MNLSYETSSGPKKEISLSHGGGAGGVGGWVVSRRLTGSLLNDIAISFRWSDLMVEFNKNIN